MYAITPKERLQQYAKHVFGSYKNMEIHCGLVNGAIGTPTELSMKNLIKVLESCPDISPDWLITGMGTMERQPQALKLKDEKPEQKKEDTQLKEATNIYNYNISGKDAEPTVTIPISLLSSIQDQLKQKDKQIDQLMQLLTSGK